MKHLRNCADNFNSRTYLVTVRMSVIGLKPGNSTKISGEVGYAAQIPTAPDEWIFVL